MRQAKMHRWPLRARVAICAGLAILGIERPAVAAHLVKVDEQVMQQGPGAGRAASGSAGGVQRDRPRLR
jgi:hypothetical protein